ncbi:hypothetical protein [Aquimarina sp. MMG016]|uniref:hypothetical protein n=1 Tax=Aquimarina sp. MMG016 TaxID=2822690 RepID=UPI001B39F48A|nr:hypothetical protein [Aquimarina sp. MMG016]MBQ4819015.1 hypothetical protein [Aquimarina sp. MMG016]
MKHIICIIFCILSLNTINAQDSTKVEAPKIITKLKLGQTLDFNSTSIKFLRVTEDSRCPSGVNCIWAGQAKLIIGIYENDTLKEEKELVFGVKGINPKRMEEVFTIDKKTIYGYTVSPYPKDKEKIAPENYYLELVVK